MSITTNKPRHNYGLKKYGTAAIAGGHRGRHIRLPQSGMTLIEVMVATAMVSLIAILTLNFLVDKVIDNRIQSARSELLQAAQQALNTMGNDVRHSANVDDFNRWADNFAPDAPVDPYSWQSNSERLVLAYPATNTNDDFIYQDPFAYITYKDNLVYFVDNGVLYRRTIAAEVDDNKASSSCPVGESGCPSDSTLARHVAGFDLDYFNANDEEVEPTDARSVQVSITLMRTIYRRNIEVDYQTRWVFRNE